MKSINMKKLFTISWPDSVRVCHGYLPQEESVLLDTTFLQNYGVKLASKNAFKYAIATQLISYNFFTHSATYRKGNPLLLTYSAEITHTYKQITSSFNFGLSTDVLPSVLLGSFPKYITVNNGIVSCNSCCFTMGLFLKNYLD